MRLLYTPGRATLAYRKVPEPTPGEGEVKLRIKGCGICGSDVHGYLGITGRRTPPMVMGHEFVGQVVELGAGVSKRSLGERVAVFPVDYCGSCPACRRGDMHLCPNKKGFGLFAWNGALAEYVCVPEKCCFPLHAQVATATGTLMEPLAVAYRSVERAGELAGRDVVIVGAGTIGLLVLACVRRKNPGQVFVVDLNDSRLSVARQMGANQLLNPTRQNVQEQLLAATGGQGVPISFEAVGITATTRQSLSVLSPGGTTVWIGNSEKMIEADMHEIVTKELSVLGSYLYSYKEFGEVAGLLNSGELQLSPLISREITLEQAPRYFEQLAKDPGDLIKVVVVDR